MKKYEVRSAHLHSPVAAGDGGRTRIVPVTLGLFDNANGRVQVSGALSANDRVVVPST